ncbi:MAG: sulfur carrier protein ThiS [Pseudomonadales bacterium]|nr:sulfur carrier protein ThiS [Pseudomonadales bacterium]
MQIIVNGETREFADNLTLSELLGQLEITEGKLAVEINGEIVPRSQHATHTVVNQDVVEIVQAIGGG